MNFKVIQQVISCFENSDVNLNYGYCENLGDKEDDGTPRGYTCGIAGWTSGNGDYQNVVSKYPPLSGFKTTSTILLKIQGFPTKWKNAAQDIVFQKLQDQVQHDEYFAPALDLAYSYSVTTPIGQLIFCDIAIQHGMESDSETSLGLIDMAAWASRYVTADETSYLRILLMKRKKILSNGGKEWAESIGRVTALEELLNENKNLVTPFKINPWGDQTFTITGV